MNCTECGKQSNTLHGERWNCNLGFIIKVDEKLCDKCASKRKGFKTLYDINQTRKK